MAFERLEGPLLPHWRTDWASATVAAIVAESNRDTKKKKKSFTQNDFMVDWEDAYNKSREVEMGSDPEKQKGVMKQLAEVLKANFQHGNRS